MLQLNIKSDEAYRLATEIARHTNESLVQAVTQALRERLERVTPRPTPEERRARIDATLAEIDAVLAEVPRPFETQEEFDDWMYDEHGLPR